MQPSSEDLTGWLKSQISRPKRQHKLLRLQPFSSIHLSNAMLNDNDTPPAQSQMVPSLSLTETATLTLFSIETCYGNSAEPVTEPETVLPSRESMFAGVVAMAETQTAKHSHKCKTIASLHTSMVHSYVNASAWDLYDTYAKVISGEDALDIKHFQLLIDTALKSRGVIQPQIGAGSEWTVLPGDEQMKRLVAMDKFQYCVLAVERLLASHNYKHKQMLYTNSPAEMRSVGTPSSCQLALLWTYDSSQHAMPVTSLDWNPQNPMLLAVGYGHLNLDQVDEGSVCLWSAKNPSHAEKRICIESSVTSLAFSKFKPNILAVACRNGTISIIDVADCSITLLSRKSLPERFGPTWKIIFAEERGGEESILSIGHAGVITKFSMNKFKPPKELMQLKYTRQVDSSETTCYSSKFLTGLSVSMVKGSDSCYVSTSQGVIVKCRVVAPCSVEALFPAHVGTSPVVAHSPACPQIFLTCGSDSCLHIWMDGICEPVASVRFVSGGAGGGMHWAAWSPTHPTLICCVTNNELHLWDIARSCTDPITVVRMRTRHQCYSLLSFSHDGTCIVVGDVLGRVRQYQLENLPRGPFLRLEALTAALRSCLAAQPSRRSLLYQFEKLMQSRAHLYTTTLHS